MFPTQNVRFAKWKQYWKPRKYRKHFICNLCNGQSVNMALKALVGQSKYLDYLFMFSVLLYGFFWMVALA